MKPLTIQKIEKLTATNAVQIKFRSNGTYSWGWAFVTKDWDFQTAHYIWNSNQELITMEPVNYSNGDRWMITFHHTTTPNFPWKIISLKRLKFSAIKTYIENNYK